VGYRRLVSSLLRVVRFPSPKHTCEFVYFIPVLREIAVAKFDNPVEVCNLPHDMMGDS
jgi:hypothetical protein